MGTPAPSFELPNAGPGPDPCALAALARGVDAVVLYFHRDHHCRNCRSQVQSVADRHAAFPDRDAAVASILPEPAAVAREWQARYELPYPLLADGDVTVADAYSQPVRFGPIGSWSDFLGRMPQVVLVDVRTWPSVAWRHRGRSTFDRPAVDAVLDRIDRLRASDPVPEH
jgi:peroxiredoxin Q/BCP